MQARGEIPKLTKLSKSNDVEAYPTTFKKLMAVYSVEHVWWSYVLALQLTGKDQKAFAIMSADQTGNYNALKATILKHCGAQ